MKNLFLLLGFCLIANTAFSQQKKWEFGIKAGMNLSKLVGPSETDTMGNGLETKKLGFRILAGGFARLRLSERFSLQADVLYTQKGGPYKFDGPAFEPNPNLPGLNQGRSVLTLNTTLNYLDVPIVVSYEIIDNRIEISAGPGIGLLFGSNSVGNLKYSEDPALNGQTLEYDLEYQYGKDAGGEAKTNAVSSVTINGDTYSYPQIVGAYYFMTDAERKARGNFYNMLDLTANVGFTYRFSGSLRVGGRWQYSLLDVTNNKHDFSMVTRDVKRNDVDRNMGFQIFVSFGF